MKKMLLILAVTVIAGTYVPRKHFCEYKLCPYKGQTKFDGTNGWDPPGSDGWALDSIHFYNQTLDYDGCEELLF